MKISTVLKICLSLCVVSFIGTVSGYLTNYNNKAVIEEPRAMAAQQMQKHEANMNSKITTAFILKETDGKIGIFSKYDDGSLSLYEVYDVPVSSLPQADRELLRNGIQENSLSGAMELIEDYIS